MAKAEEKDKKDKPDEMDRKATNSVDASDGGSGAETGLNGSDDKENEPTAEGKMHIKVYSPYQVYFNDQANSISAVNETGPFDILPQHHKFLTLLSPCELVIATDEKGEQKIKISRGIMFVKEDRIAVFLDV